MGRRREEEGVVARNAPLVGKTPVVEDEEEVQLRARMRSEV